MSGRRSNKRNVTRGASQVNGYRGEDTGERELEGGRRESHTRGHKEDTTRVRKLK